MIILSVFPLSLRNLLLQLGFAVNRQHPGFAAGTRRNPFHRISAALGRRSAASPATRRCDLLLRDAPERFRSHCRDCGEDTPHEGVDEFGTGWYAQIWRCRRCGRQGMRVWTLGWW